MCGISAVVAANMCLCAAYLQRTRGVCLCVCITAVVSKPLDGSKVP